MRERPPAVAGFFYPASQATLTAQVDGFIAGGAEPGATAPPAILVPHAGYDYSGSTAGLAYALWRGADIRHVIIIGPTHRVGIEAIALPDAEVMGTPLGFVPIWYEGAKTALDFPQVVVSARVHAEEHSLEVQLPFLQRTLASFDVLPLAAGWVTPKAVADVIEALWETPNLGVVISSDLSHYHTYDDARRIDAETIDQVRALDATIDHDQACGATGLDAMLLVAKLHGLRPRMLGACNSGDTAGDKRRVVGYTAFAFEHPEKP